MAAQRGQAPGVGLGTALSARELSLGQAMTPDMANARLLSRINDLSTGGGEVVVGDYRIVRTLGKGTCGIVKLCVHKTTNEEVAIKIISRGELDSSPDVRRRAEAEVKVLRSLSHPFICPLRDLIETPEHKYIVMEYLPGGELYDVILKRGRLTPEEVHLYFATAYCAVLHLHNRMVYHRDIKPENLLLDRKGRLKLCDFGFAYTARGAGERVATECGSPHYAAPEVVAREAHSPALAEVWSLGVLLFCLITSTLPFDAPTVGPVLFDRIRSGAYKLPDDVPRGIGELIQHRMLLVDPRRRVPLRDIAGDRWFNERLGRLPFDLKQALDEELRAGSSGHRASPKR